MSIPLSNRLLQLKDRLLSLNGKVNSNNLIDHFINDRTGMFAKRTHTHTRFCESINVNRSHGPERCLVGGLRLLNGVKLAERNASSAKAKPGSHAALNTRTMPHHISQTSCSHTSACFQQMAISTTQQQPA